ncbi:hypothetical protein CE143_15060 [Photorhabdus luminescens]|uniref:Uncharacterized protein n=1 Tax=Photorhabdus akhurstii TaxID=171438 RepID=A0ABX8LVC9_9GAMM|nr:hypothetical protein [Photorhabdus akhurstii]QXF34321.1 hypothetical protein B0X70_15065 [Photorhabdus akhurstii]UJD76145.1 hypothetical protein CE143_15060 [Photorhabdus luminescens]
MKLISLIKPIAVNYFGIELLVPFWTKFIVTESKGIVLAWNKKPSELKGYWDSESQQSQYEIVAIVDLDGTDWKETLVEI